MNYLCIDTTKKIAQILSSIEGNQDSISLGENEKHSENLLPAIDQLLANNHITLDGIDCLGIVTGPGSFTGIRVGLATLKAFCFGKKKKVVAFSHFDLVSQYIKNGTMLLPSTRTTYYMGKIKNSKVIETKVIEQSDYGSNCFAYREDIERMPKEVCVIDCYEQLVREYMDSKIITKEFQNIESIEPFYLQLSQAERQWEDKYHD